MCPPFLTLCVSERQHYCSSVSPKDRFSLRYCVNIITVAICLKTEVCAQFIGFSKLLKPLQLGGALRFQKHLVIRQDTV